MLALIIYWLITLVNTLVIWVLLIKFLKYRPVEKNVLQKTSKSIAIWTHWCMSERDPLIPVKLKWCYALWLRILFSKNIAWRFSEQRKSRKISFMFSRRRTNWWNSIKKLKLDICIKSQCLWSPKANPLGHLLVGTRALLSKLRLFLGNPQVWFSCKKRERSS